MHACEIEIETMQKVMPTRGVGTSRQEKRSAYLCTFTLPEDHILALHNKHSIETRRRQQRRSYQMRQSERNNEINNNKKM